jgi:uncharacterized membrane protein YvbJ
MNCTHCGREIPSNNIFCGNCGTKKVTEDKLTLENITPKVVWDFIVGIAAIIVGLFIIILSLRFVFG